MPHHNGWSSRWPGSSSSLPQYIIGSRVGWKKNMEATHRFNLFSAGRVSATLRRSFNKSMPLIPTPPGNPVKDKQKHLEFCVLKRINTSSPSDICRLIGETKTIQWSTGCFHLVRLQFVCHVASYFCSQLQLQRGTGQRLIKISAHVSPNPIGQCV